MEFQFDLIWRKPGNCAAADLADALTTDPVMVINPATKEDPRIINNLFRL